MIGRAALSLLMLTSPVAAAAQDEAAAMKTLEAAVPRQSWYPAGYYDVRIAAEAQVAEFPRPAADLPTTSDQSYNLVVCNAERVALEVEDPMMERYGNVALEAARLRAELQRLGYPADLYAEPLLVFERDLIARADGASVDDPYEALANSLEAGRSRGEPGLPSVFAFDECNAPTAAPPPRPKPAKPHTASGVKFSTQPPAGEVLLINAFAFKVCVRRQPDPWDRFACRWNEIETGIAKPLAGRFVYQVKWPDGTVRKGTREIAPGESATVTFRKVGS